MTATAGPHGQGWMACATLLGITGLAKLPTLGQPLLETHIFRQTQTAYTALIFHEHGIDLLRPQVPVFGPPWVLPFEFPLFQAAGALLMDVGLPPDTAMRTLGLATFLLTGALLFGLLRRVGGEVAGLIGLMAFLFSPFGMLWGRTSLIEYLATAGGIGFLWAGTAWADRGHAGAYAFALLAGSVAVLTKITTGGFYLLPLLFYRGGRPSSPKMWTLLGALVIVPLALGLAWTSHADQLKLASQGTELLASSSGSMRAGNFGVLADRFDPTFWMPILGRLVFLLTGLALPLWAVLAALSIRERAYSRFLGAFLLICTVAPMVILLPLYNVHDYYLIAISPAIATAIGLGGAWLWRHRRRQGARAVAVAATTAWLAGLVLTSGYWGRAYVELIDLEGTLPAAEYLRSRTDADEWVVLRGRDWDPSVFYYARRRGFMIRPSADATALIERLRADSRYSLFVDCPFSQTCGPMEVQK